MTKNRTLRLPDDLDAWLMVEAARAGGSVQAYLQGLVEAAKRAAEAEGASHPIIEKPPIPVGEGDTLQVLKFDKTTDGPPINPRPSPTATILDAQGPPVDSKKGKASSTVPCTCTPAERKGDKHNKWCPAK